jgi:hypothetical protein
LRRIAGAKRSGMGVVPEITEAQPVALIKAHHIVDRYPPERGNCWLRFKLGDRTYLWYHDGGYERPGVLGAPRVGNLAR